MKLIQPLSVPLSILILIVIHWGFPGCAHKEKVKHFSKSNLQAKKVALAEIQGAARSKTHVEVAIINELIDNGHFEIIDRSTVQNALAIYPTESDWKALGEKVDADYLLSIRIAEFKVTERKGLDRVTVKDPVLAEEYGEDDPILATRYVKVKSRKGAVRLNAIIFDVQKNAIVYIGSAYAQEKHNSREKHFPSKLELLEGLSRKAVSEIFKKMP